MFKAVLLLLFAGMSEPAVFDRPDHERPFVGIAAAGKRLTYKTLIA